MLLNEIKKLKTAPRDLRKFGLVVGGVFALLALWFWLRHKPYFGWLLIPAVPLLALGTVYPKSLKWIYVGWMSLALVLGHIMSTVLLVLFFYLVVTPIGLFARVLGKDFLNRRWEPDAPSYWLSRASSKPPEKGDYERQF